MQKREECQEVTKSDTLADATTVLSFHATFDAERQVPFYILLSI